MTILAGSRVAPSPKLCSRKKYYSNINHALSLKRKHIGRTGTHIAIEPKAALAISEEHWILNPFSRWRSSRKSCVSLFGIVGLILIGGLLFAGGSQAVHSTNTLEFCTSCHEMRDNNFAEYKDTIHAKNRTGVKAICSDCHVPHDVIGMATRKVLAARDLVGHFAGVIDTKESFEAHRLELAKRVWLHMKKTDSAECRSCHDVKAMDQTVQGATARKQHQKIGINGKTCIDCHYGIAHDEPSGDVTPQDVLDEDKATTSLFSQLEPQQ